jgi:hypothetical protein
MSGKRKKRGRPPRIDAGAKVAMLAALREGRRLDEVAEAYGVTLQGFYRARRRDPLFAAAWRDAHAISAASERNPITPLGGHWAELGEDHIVPNNRRVLQRRKMRHVRFDRARQGAFLAHFALSGDTIAAAAAAGVCERTTYVHRRRDPVFAAEFQDALEQSRAVLEAEAMRARLAAQRKLRAAIEAAEPKAGAELGDAVEADFDRTMKLLARWDRRGGGTGPREVRHGRRQRMSFDEAIVILDKKLRNLGL